MILKQGDKIFLAISNLGSNGEGVGKFGEYVVFVKNALVGEEVFVRLSHVKKNIAFADLLAVKRLSPNRVEPPCPYYGECGGCQLQHMDYQTQLHFKRQTVQNNLSKIGGFSLPTVSDLSTNHQNQMLENSTKLSAASKEISPSTSSDDDCSVTVLDTIKSPKIWGYRNKISLPVGGKKGDVVIGMYKADTHEIVEVSECLLTENWAKIVIETARDFFNQQGVLPYNQSDFSGEIRHVTARHIDGQLLCTLVTNGEFRHNTAPLVRQLQKYFDKFGLFVNINTQKNNVIAGEITKHIFGITHIESCHFSAQNFENSAASNCTKNPIEPNTKTQPLTSNFSENSTHYTLKPDSFFQVNDGVKDLIYSDAKRLLDVSKIDVLVDCFSGVGLLTCAVATNDFDTYAIEIQRSAVADANQQAALNGLTRLQNICGDVNVELPKLMQKLEGKNTALIVDPPRKGLGENICQTILKNPPSQIIYISCDSATLARDLKSLSQKYHPTHIQPYDMFPQTRHVETLICLKLKPQN